MNNVIEKIIEEQNSLSEKGILDSLTVNDNVNRLKSIEALLINNQGLAVIKNQISQLKVGDQYKKNLEQYVHDFHNPIQPESENVCEISDSNEVVNVTAKANETQAGNNEEENQQPPAPNQPTPPVIQNQFELGIALGVLQKETNSLKEYIDNILARQRDTDASINNQIEQYRNIQNNMGILSETIKNIEPILIKITPEIQEATKNIKEQLVQAISDSDLFKKLPEYKTEIDSMLKTIRDAQNNDLDDLYKKMRVSAAGIVDEVVENSKKSIVESGVEIVKTAEEISAKAIDKKYTNLMIFGLLGFFICSGLTSAFTAKLVATYSSNNTIEYITKLLNAAADKNKEQQQVKKSKK